MYRFIEKKGQKRTFFWGKSNFQGRGGFSEEIFKKSIQCVLKHLVASENQGNCGI